MPRRPALDLVAAVVSRTLRLAGQNPAVLMPAGRIAAVFVAGTDAATAHPKHPAVEVDVGPGQTQRFPLAKAEGQRQGPPGSVAALAGNLQQLLHLGDRVWLDLVRFDARSPGDGSGVARDVPAAKGGVERRADRAVGLVGGRRLAALGDHRGVQAFEVFGFELVQPVRSYPGDQVHPNRDAVGVQRAGPDASGGDVLRPVLQPSGHRPVGTGFANAAAVAGLLQFADRPDCLGLGRALDVPAVRSPVVTYSDGDPAVPLSVRAAVNRGGAVRPSGPVSHVGPRCCRAVGRRTP